MSLDRANDYSMYLYTCNRCRTCAVEPSAEHKPICPSYALFGYFTYTGGGRGYVAQGILEGKVKPTPETAELAMNCLMCGACAAACPPGFDINSFVRDLRDHLVSAGIHVNPNHEKILDSMHTKGNPYGKSLPAPQAPVFTGGRELLVWQGCRDRLSGQVISSVGKILDAAGVSWGVLPDEPCCGVPLQDLGDKKGFEQAAQNVLETVEASGAERMLIVCPHCAAGMAVDYVMDIGDLTAEPVTLPALLSELIGEEKIKLSGADPLKVTFHDPCRLARWLEETDPSREVLDALDGVELYEMERIEEWGWCCGASGFAPEVAKKLSDFTARERIKEARATGAEAIVTACSYCTDLLEKKSRGKQRVVHIAELLAERL